MKKKKLCDITRSMHNLKSVSEKMYNYEFIWLLLRPLTACQMKPVRWRLEGKTECSCWVCVRVHLMLSVVKIRPLTRWPCLTRLPALTLSPSLSYLPSLTSPSHSLSSSIHPSTSCARRVVLSFSLASGDNSDTSGMDALAHTLLPPPPHTFAVLYTYTDKQPRPSLTDSHTWGEMSFVRVLSAGGALSPTSTVWSLFYSRGIIGYNSPLSCTGLQSGDSRVLGCVWKCW